MILNSQDLEFPDDDICYYKSLGTEDPYGTWVGNNTMDVWWDHRGQTHFIVGDEE